MKTTYYPHLQAHPYAAYLIPDDLEQGEKVFIEDIIEDIFAGSHNGSAYRLNNAEAVWDGEKFNINKGNPFLNIGIG